MATAAAKRYARAVFELAGDEREVDDWMRRLEQLRDLLSDERVAAVLTNPTIPIEQRMDVITSASLDPETTNLAKLTASARSAPSPISSRASPTTPPAACAQPSPRR